MSSTWPLDNTGKAIFKAQRRPGDAEIQATDAKLIAQIDSTYISATNTDVLSRGANFEDKLIISTPNADYLPNANVANQVVVLCQDGRWGEVDWAQWPQWYFERNPHYPYVLRQPSPADLPKHPLRILWWNIDERYFVHEPGIDVGFLAKDISDQLYDIRSKLMTEIVVCPCQEAQDFRILSESARKMRACTSALRHTPHSYNDVKLLLASAQRYCLQTRAILDKIKKWDKQQVAETPVVDNGVIGCITDRSVVVWEMWERGVPVWFVRPLWQVQPIINIVQQGYPVRPGHHGIITSKLYDHVFYQGPLAPEMHVHIDGWKPGILNLQLVGKGSASELDEGSPANKTQNQPQVAAGPIGDKPGSSNAGARHATPYSRPASVARSEQPQPKPQPQISLNLKLFESPDWPYTSRPLDAWGTALSNVVKDCSRVIQHANLLTFRGYAFPPPQIFCGDNDANGLDRMLAWLLVRTSWMATVGNTTFHDIPLPNPQHWRDYLRNVALGLELTRPDTRVQAPPASSASHQGQSKKTSSATRVRREKTRKAVVDIFKINVPSKEILQRISWNGRVVWSPNNVDLPTLERKLLVWDAQEHNFRLELLTLDRCLLADIWSTTEGTAARDDKFSALWPNEAILMAELPAEAQGLSAEDWRSRRSFVEAFRQIIMDWPGHIPQELSRLSFRSCIDGQDVWDRAVMEKVEAMAASYYCQTFFDYFGRAASIPHVLPVA